MALAHSCSFRFFEDDCLFSFASAGRAAFGERFLPVPNLILRPLARPTSATAQALILPRHDMTTEDLMNRLYGLAFVAMASALVLSSPSFAQSTSSMQSMSGPADAPATSSTPPTSKSKTPATLSDTMNTSAGQQKAQKDQARAQKHAQQVAMRTDCRTQAKQQGLSRQTLRDYVKSCVSGQQQQH
jgi:hypothetical protein